MSRSVIVGMSGGVDSSVAALLLQQQGYEVSGLFMFNWSEDEDGYCDAAKDFQDARQVCEVLGIPLLQADFSDQYRKRVFDYFLSEYAAGRTPNPDVLCNREIKFNAFREHALALGAEVIATGHYARLATVDGESRLLRAVDPSKDQSYFLAAVPGAAFDQVIFPLGETPKDEVRAIARRAGLPVHAKKDSTGICFIGERNFPEFLGRYLPAQPGDIEDDSGAVLGRHGGLMNYTLGQRRGLGVGGRRDAQDKPWYVIDKDLERNVLLASQDRDHPRLLSHQLSAGDWNWIGTPPPLPAESQAMIRYRQKAHACRLESHSDTGCTLHFETAQWAATPGQYAVAYDGDRCLGGGVIEQIETMDQSADSISKGMSA